jgi:hypothetical protein
MLKENLRDYFVLNYNGICYAHVKPSQTSFSVRVWQVTLNNVFLHMWYLCINPHHQPPLIKGQALPTVNPLE